MADTQFSYPFDPTGTKATNHVVGENQVVSPPVSSDFYFIIPIAAPYFKDTMKLWFKDGTGSRVPMIEGKDWIPTYFFIGASRSTAKPVYGSITFLNAKLQGVVELDYQCVGGEWTIDRQKALWIIANSTSNPRITTWDEIDDRPNRFPPTDHPWHLDDMVGMKETVEALDRIEAAIYARNSDDLANHLTDFDNPHQVTKAQVGLGLVQNYGLSSKTQAEVGSAEDSYMTPLRTLQAVKTQVADSYNLHRVDYSNPHRVTQAQVGLSLVQNFATATPEQAAAGTANNLYITPLGLAANITLGVGQDLLNHTSDQDNPHRVTKEQVGLGLVSNFRPATDAEAALAAATNLYITPANGRKMVEAVAGGLLDVHTTDFNNPHRVTKAQVGLSLVQNFSIATEEEAVDGTLNIRYMTPLSTKQAIDKQAGDMIRAHVDDKGNPHGVTKAQVGLGSVENYAIATSPEAIQGTVNNKYMTPLRTKEAVDNFNTTIVQPHITSRSNPHGVTKAQIGLPDVENYGIATNPEALQGALNTKYMTPLRTKEVVDAFNASTVQPHINNRNNPHGVTPGQIGSYTTGESESRMAAHAQVVQNNLNAHTGNWNNPHNTNKSHVGLGQVQDWPIASEWDIANGTGARYVPADALKAFFNNNGVGANGGGYDNGGLRQYGWSRLGPLLINYGRDAGRNFPGTQRLNFMRTYALLPAVVASVHNVSNGSPSRSLITVDNTDTAGFTLRTDGIGIWGYSFIAIGVPA